MEEYWQLTNQTARQLTGHFTVVCGGLWWDTRSFDTEFGRTKVLLQKSIFGHRIRCLLLRYGIAGRQILDKQKRLLHRII